MYPVPALGSSIDDGYEIALREMVGELAIQYYPSASIDGAYIFKAHDETPEQITEREKLARLLYFLIRSAPLQNVVKEGLAGITNDQAKLHFVTQFLIRLVGHGLCTEIVIAANVLLYIINRASYIAPVEVG